MKSEIILQEGIRAEAFTMWMSPPVPMVTLVKTFDAPVWLRSARRVVSEKQEVNGDE